MGAMRYFQNQFSITGCSAVGTSSAMKALKTRLPENLYRFVSVGTIMRQLAEQTGLSIEDFVKHRMANPSLKIDMEIDKIVNILGLTDFGVLESRLGFRLWPMAYQVRLICPLEFRASRRAKQVDITTVEARTKIIERDDGDRLLYEGLYGPQVLWDDEDSRFHLVIDTSTMEVEEVADAILKGHKSWKTKLDPSSLPQTPIWAKGAINFDEFYFQ